MDKIYRWPLTYLAEAKQKNMFVSGGFMIWNRVGRSAFNFFFYLFKGI